MKKFPENFYWGAATAAYQVEGCNENTDWAKAAKEGRVPVAGRLANHYERYEEDFDIAKELGHNAHRFSIEWARIEPREGEFDHNEVEHYRTVLRALRKRKVEPFVTLWHFTLPLWFSESGGFERKDAPEIFARYCAFVVKEMGDLCQHFSTMNEPNVYATHGWLYAEWPPFKRGRLFWKKLGSKHSNDTGFSNVLAYFKVTKNLSVAHNMAYEEIKKVSSSAVVSVVKQVHVYDSNWNPINMIKAFFSRQYQNHRIMRRINDSVDEIGLNYYHYTKYGDTREWEKTDMGWNMAPEYLYEALRSISVYKKPVFISEAGLADAEDKYRADYIRRQVEATSKALEKGIDVRGHFYWSLMDNYEWALGTKMRFGLVEIDYETLERKIRPSAWEYKRIIERNGVVE